MFYQWQGDDLVLSVRVQPRASANGFAEILGDAIKLRITAPPVDGEANSHVTAFLAKAFKVARTDVRILSGTRSRNKRIRIRRPARLPDIIEPPS